VWQSDRNAYSAIGGNEEGVAALAGVLRSAGLAAALVGRAAFLARGFVVAMVGPPAQRPGLECMMPPSAKIVVAVT
jgi:hypothetical protein